MKVLKALVDGIQIGLFIAYIVGTRVFPLVELYFMWDVMYLFETNIRFAFAIILINIPSALVWWRILTTHL